MHVRPRDIWQDKSGVGAYLFIMRAVPDGQFVLVSPIFWSDRMHLWLMRRDVFLDGYKKFDPRKIRQPTVAARFSREVDRRVRWIESHDK
jgi:hypothetical protein